MDTNFSPLFIGEFSSTTSLRRSRGTLQHFSPLFIGEFSSTPSRCGSLGEIVSFQSPLHRGVLFNYVTFQALWTLFMISVPSSSGSSLQQPCEGFERVQVQISVPSSSGSSLQPDHQIVGGHCAGDFSPLFIGEFSSTSRRAATGRWTCISVPSSSGSSLQRSVSRRIRGRTAHFSPLFIGEFSSTRRPVDARLHADAFQSPLHRGVLFNAGGQVRRACAVPNFSPLFIGEFSSTPGTDPIYGSGTGFQSPLHRGVLFNFTPQRDGKYFFRISVPSSSGSSLQRQSSIAPSRLPSHFSPLFIGEFSSTDHKAKRSVS